MTSAYRPSLQDIAKYVNEAKTPVERQKRKNECYPFLYGSTEKHSKQFLRRNSMTRIKLTDTTVDACFKLSEGNPGAITVLLALLERTNKIDPDLADGTLLVLMLDTFEVYGSKIWRLYKDVCGEHIGRTILMIRAVQLGHLTQDALHAHIDGGPKPDFDALLAKIKLDCQKFNINA